MDWLSLEGIPRVHASYRVWKRCSRILRNSRKMNVSKKTLRFLKEDVRYEFDELVDAILCLTDSQIRDLLSSLKHNRLYFIVSSLAL